MATLYKDSQPLKSNLNIPSLILIHFSMISAQSIFGIGSVVSKLGISVTNPLLFSFLREIISGPLLIITSLIINKKCLNKQHLNLFLIPSIFLYLNALFFSIGLKLSSSVTASSWQTSQGIIAILIGYCLGYEKYFDFYKIFGIILAFIGALCLILFSNYVLNNNQHNNWYQFGGSICFFINCSNTVLYLLFTKKLLKIYPSLTVIGYSYMFASILMIITVSIIYIFNPFNILYEVICPNCTKYTIWSVPNMTIVSLSYSVIFKTFLSWSLMTWSNKYCDVSINLSYCVLQPLTAVILSELLILLNIVQICNLNDVNEASAVCLNGASWNDLGGIPIAIGLYFVVYSEQNRRKQLISKIGTNLQYGSVSDSNSELSV